MGIIDKNASHRHFVKLQRLICKIAAHIILIYGNPDLSLFLYHIDLYENLKIHYLQMAEDQPDAAYFGRYIGRLHICPYSA